MSARGKLIAALSSDSLGGIATLQDVTHAEALVDAHDAEVTLANAALVEDKACDADWHKTSGFCAGLRRAVELLTEASQGKPSHNADVAPIAPGLFQPGHTYAHGPWRFHCGTITSHPGTGEQSALGWLQISDGSWTTCAYTAAERGEDWTDVTEGGGR